MKNLSFHKLLFRRNFFSLVKDSPLLPYSYLQSTHLNLLVEPMPSASPIKKFLNSDFNHQQLLKQKHLLQEYYDQQLKITKVVNESIRSQQLDIMNTLDVMVKRNIINIDTWMGLLKITLNSKLKEMETNEQFGNVMIVFKKYIEKFVSKRHLHRYKFNIFEKDLVQYDFNLLFTEMYRMKGPINNLKNEGNIFNFIKEMSLKIPFDLSEVKRYYSENSHNLTELLHKEDSIINIMTTYYIYHMLGIQTNNITKCFQQRLQQVYENTKIKNSQINVHDNIRISNMWAITGKINQSLKINEFDRISDSILQYNKSIHFLYSLTIVNKENQYIIDKILSDLDLFDVNINLKIDLHKCLHILEIRGYNLSKHQKLIKKLSSICTPNYPEVISKIVRKVDSKSPCMHNKPSNHTNALEYTTIDKRIQKALKNIQAILGSQFQLFRNLRICRFNIQAMISQGNNFIAIQFNPGKQFLIKPIGQNKIKKEILSYYGIKYVELDVGCAEFENALQTEDPDALIDYLLQKTVKNH